jgi:hypothetical protein
MDEQASACQSLGLPTEHAVDPRTLLSLRYPLYDGFRRTPEQDRLSQLGCRIIAHNRYEESSSFGRSVWESLLPQLSRALPTVNSAAAALGAVYELRFLFNNNDQSNPLAELQYNVALRTLQQDIECQPHGTVPLILACVLLTCAELLHRRQLNALTHLQGAFQLLSSHHKASIEASSPESEIEDGSSVRARKDSHLVPDDALQLMFRALDIHVSSYVLGRPPDLSPAIADFRQVQLRQFRSVNEAQAWLVPLIHSCYHFTPKASEYKYLPRTSIPSELLIEQGRYIAHLSSWLATLDRDILCRQVDDSHKPVRAYRHALMLRAQCLITIVWVSSVMNPFEIAYDKHASLFQQIIDNSAAALGENHAHFTGLGGFSPGPGVMHPLFFTALNYRSSTWRRKAIDLLRGAGREGPWDGKLLAAVAARTVEIEEAGLALDCPEEIAPQHVAERYRVHGAAMDAEAREGKPMNVVEVTFSRCYDIEEMLLAKVPFSDESNWCCWDEALTF